MGLMGAELFKYAGDGVLQSLLEVYNLVKQSREIPEQWDLVNTGVTAVILIILRFLTKYRNI